MLRFMKVFKLLIEADNCNLLINDNTTVGSAKFQLGEKNTEIKIGKNCMLSRDIIINTSDFHSIIDLNTTVRINHSKSVNIGNHVWIGNGVYVNKGANINDDSIVAARSVVPGKMLESNSIIGGVPAKVIKEKVNWERKLL